MPADFWRPCCLLLLATGLVAAILDRIEVVVGDQVITELELEEELRVTAFLNEQPVKTGVSDRRSATERLVDQKLIMNEMALAHYPTPTELMVDDSLAQLKQTIGADFLAKLSAASLTVEMLRRHLALQIAAVRFVGFRFRPELGISEADLQDEYRRQAGNWSATQSSKPIPTYEAARDGIRRSLLDQRTSDALSNWLAQTRKQTRIEYVDKSLNGENR